MGMTRDESRKVLAALDEMYQSVEIGREVSEDWMNRQRKLYESLGRDFEEDFLKPYREALRPRTDPFHWTRQAERHMGQYAQKDENHE